MDEDEKVDIDKILEGIDFDEIDTETKYDLAVKLYQEGVSTSEIIKKLHINPRKFYKLLEEKGVEKRRVQRAREKLVEEVEKRAKRDERLVLPKALQRVLDSSYAGVTRKVIEQVDWFTTAIHEIGLGAMFMAFQIAKVDPQEVFDRVVEFRDPHAFADYVLSVFSAIPEVINDAMVLHEYRERLIQYKAMLRLAMEKMKQMHRQIFEMRFMLESLLARVPSDVRNKWFEDMLRIQMLRGIIGGVKGGESRTPVEEEASGRAGNE